MPTQQFNSQSILERRVHLGAEVFLVDGPDGSSRLLDLNGQFYALTAIATTMLKHCLNHDLAESARRVAEEYNVDGQQVLRDIEELLSDLQQQKLVVTDPAAAVHNNFWLKPFAGLLKVVGLLLIWRRWSSDSKAWALLFAARISFAVLGWTRTVRLWEELSRCRDVPPAGDASERLAVEIDRTVREAAARHLFQVNCKERAISCWALLRAVNSPVQLLLGVNLMPLAGHAWCLAGSQVLSDYPEHCEKFIPIVAYE